MTDAPHQSGQRTAVVTGAAGGLGSAVVRSIANDRTQVIAVDLDEVRIREATGNHPSVQAYAADLGDWSSCGRVISDAIEQYGRVDVLVNSAAILNRTEPEDVDQEVFERIMNVNCRAAFILMRDAMRDMESRGWGRIVNVTSIGVHTGGYNLNSAVYEASKAAVGNFTRTFARYGAPRGILVNTVAPGGMRTPMLTKETAPELLSKVEADIPVGRLAEPEEVAHLIAHLAGDDNTYASGATFDVNGGVVMP